MIKVGARNTGASTTSLVHRSTEEVQNETDNKGKQQDGYIDGVVVPVPAGSF